MSKLRLVAEKQFRKEVLSRGFLFAVLSLPLFLAFSIGMGALVENLTEETATVGYVDQAGFLAVASTPAAESGVVLVDFDSADAARAALDLGQIDAFFILPPDYPADPKVELISFDRLPGWATRHFNDVLRVNLLADFDQIVVDRALAGPRISVQAVDVEREFPDSGPPPGSLLVVVMAVLFAFLVMIVSATLMEAVVEEKENRTMEILATSISVGRLMAGKILGIAAMGFLLFLAWTFFLAAAGWIAAQLFDVSWLKEIQVNWRDTLLLGTVAVPAFLSIAALMTMLGSTLIDSQEAHQIGPLMFIVLMVPLYFLVPIARNPAGPGPVAASILPFTAVPVLAVRSLFMEVPAWQFIAAAALSAIFAIALIWLAGRAFRLSMLRYGSRLPVGDIFQRRSTGSPAAQARSG
ncbi:MAG: ABC transporter permease [Chloroflexota bacterium]|nr:ABC transporter permease [Chloroflexota bacterium]